MVSDDIYWSHQTNHNTRSQDGYRNHRRRSGKVNRHGIAQATGTDCEAFSNDVGSVVIYNHTELIARITPLFSGVDVAPLRGPFVGHITEVPYNAWTLNDLREIGHAMDEATSHVLNAALNH